MCSALAYSSIFLIQKNQGQNREASNIFAWISLFHDPSSIERDLVTNHLMKKISEGSVISRRFDVLLQGFLQEHQQNISLGWQ